MGPPPVKFASDPEMRVAYLECRGPYAGVRGAMLELQRWVRSKGAEGSGFPFCLFFDNPFDTPEADLRSAACVPVKGELSPEGRYEVRVFRATEVAETRHEGTPESFGETYGPFLEGLINQGYGIGEPAREYFRRAEDVRGPGSGFAIRQPVAKK